MREHLPSMHKTLLGLVFSSPKNHTKRINRKKGESLLCLYVCLYICDTWNENFPRGSYVSILGSHLVEMFEN